MRKSSVRNQRLITLVILGMAVLAVGASVEPVRAISLFHRAHTNGTNAVRRIPAPMTVPNLDQITFANNREGVIGGKGIIYTTTDGGAHWRVSYRGKAIIYSFDFLNARFGWALGTHTLLFTTNGGQSWAPISSAEPPLSQVQFITPRIGFGIHGTGGTPDLYSGSKGLLETSDGGKHWTTVPRMQTVDSVTFVSSTIGFAVSPTKLLYTQNGGHTWVMVRRFRLGITLTRRASTNAVWLLALNGVAAGHGSYLLYRVTKHTMTVVAQSPYFFPHSLKTKGVPDGNLTGWSSRGDTVWLIASLPIGNSPYEWSYSTNGGQSWSQRGTIQDVHEYNYNQLEPLSLDFPTPDAGWMVSNNANHGVLWKSANAGISWHTVDLAAVTSLTKFGSSHV